MRDFQDHLFSGSLTNIASWIVALFSVIGAFAVSKLLPAKGFKEAGGAEQAGELDERQVDDWLKEIRNKYAKNKLNKSN